MYDIYKGNLSSELKEEILDTLTAMLESSDVEKQKYAIDTMLKYRRELSQWPEVPSEEQ